MAPRSVLHYRLLQKIGAGGMGEVYKARDDRLNRLVAIKLLSENKADDPERRRRFFQEAHAASSLNHPNIITIHDIVSDGQEPCIVLEYVDGKTLADVIPKEGLPISQILRFGVQLADALNVVHGAGIVHRDLKPGNIMVTNAGLVKVLDFGLAKLVETVPESQFEATVKMRAADFTVEGSILGTVSYMSPEQAQGKRVDARSDIFSFGAVLYEMTTGWRAFEGDSAISTLSAILRDDPTPISQVTPGVPARLQEIINRCLRKNPDERWQTMREISTELSALTQESDSGTLYAPQIAAAKPPSPRKASWLVVAGIVVVIADGWWWAGHRQTQPPAAIVPESILQPAKPALTRPTTDSTLTNDSILEMVQAKAPVSVIISHIRSSKTNFVLSTNELIRLVKGGVPESVIEVMRNPKAEPGQAASEPHPVAAIPPTPDQPSQSAPAVQPISVKVGDGLPFRIVLSEDIPADAEAGRLLHFTAGDDLRVNGTVIIAKGAAATGEIVEAGKKKFLSKGKLTFRLRSVQGIDGRPLKVRAAPTWSGEGSAQRPVETAAHKRSKDLAAPQGAEYIGYLDGEQTVSVPR